ncbi:GntR family transcriptional regulator [Rhodobacteraceae bacterium 2CG4]|uniref:GntR family transcriptional regulator n=1 Tax=Halovulum marinum TaxID=2662447 RepID=A0A6L5Z2P3_9RHOB|nr:GntR family transcriptional regulator [Halovulum marinum]MSU90797.1 GntR family transcriptional regulator [Halovulum marinum]
MARAKSVLEAGPILSDRAHDAIKEDILAGALEPGEKLQLDAISDRYGIGTAPVREALNRLSAEGWVEHRSQRGFFVSELSYPGLEELVKTRIWLETLALRESIAHGGQEWEDALILSYHRLARTDRFLNAGDGRDSFTLNPDWEVRHHEFHRALLSGCGSSLMEQFCVQMMERSIRYRNLSVKFSLARRGDALAEHEAILTAALDRDADLAVRQLTDHYRLTLEGLRARLFPKTKP